MLGEFFTRRGFRGGEGGAGGENDSCNDIAAISTTAKKASTSEEAIFLNIHGRERSVAASLWLKYVQCINASEITPDFSLKTTAAKDSGSGGNNGAGSPRGDASKQEKDKEKENDKSGAPHNTDAVELLSRTIAFGPKSQGPNILLLSPDAVVEVWSPIVPKRTTGTTGTDGETGTSSSYSSYDDNSHNNGGGSGDGYSRPNQLASVSFQSQRRLFDRVWSRIASAVAAGFQVATAAGPLMQEPLHGVGVSIEKIEISRSALAGICNALELESMGLSATSDNEADGTPTSPTSTVGGGSGSGSGADGNVTCSANASATANASASAGTLMIGQLISDVKDAVRLALLSCPVRIVEPVYACDLQCDQSQLGNLYAVLSKRRGQVHKEDIIEGTSLFLLSATLPVAESFGFAQELLKRTSGNGTAPQLRFSHWSVQEEDPFWRPTTAEELEDHGELAAEPNMARACIDKARKRKGLSVEEKIVVFAEKQRTLNKKK
jgi:hypothetical protein